MGLMLIHKEDEPLFFIVDDLLPEIVALLVAFAWCRVEYSNGVGVLVEFESEDHKECVAGEGLEEELLVVDLDHACDLAKRTVFVFFVYFVYNLFVLLLVEPFAVEGCFFLDCRLKLKSSQTDHNFLLKAK